MLCWPVRTRRTPLALTATLLTLSSQLVLGRSSRIRSGLDAVSYEGFTGALSVTSTRRSAPSRAAVTLCTVAGAAVFCAAAQDNKSIKVPRCF